MDNRRTKDEQRTDEGWRKDRQRTNEGRTKEGRRTDEGRTKDGRRTDEGRTKDGRRKDEGRTRDPRRIHLGPTKDARRTHKGRLKDKLINWQGFYIRNQRLSYMYKKLYYSSCGIMLFSLLRNLLAALDLSVTFRSHLVIVQGLIGECGIPHTAIRKQLWY